MKNILLEDRNCECCGNKSNKLELIWSGSRIVKGISDTYLFEHSISVCSRGGVAFSSPCPTEESLKVFYGDSLSNFGVLPAYSVEKRLDILKNLSLSYESTIVEIGGNYAKEFHSEVNKLFDKFYNIELNNDINISNSRSLINFNNEVDVIAHYDVLEHVPNVKKFLKLCYSALKDDGIMVCEVPNVRLYNRSFGVQDVFHVNHFSVTTLSRIAKYCGFELIKVGHNASSRAISFVTVFKKTNIYVDKSTYVNQSEYFDTISILYDSIEQVKMLHKHIEEIRKKILKLINSGKSVTLWAVTEFLSMFLDNFDLPEKVVVVDADPRKSNMLKHKNISVSTPEVCRKHIINSDLLVIFSPRSKNNILEWINKDSAILDNKKVEVIGVTKSNVDLNSTQLLPRL